MKIYEDEKEVATLTEKGITTADEGLEKLYKAASETGLGVRKGWRDGNLMIDAREQVYPPSKHFMLAFARVLHGRGFRIEF